MTSIEPSGDRPKPGDLVEVTYRGTVSDISPVLCVKVESDGSGGIRSVPTSATVTVLRVFNGDPS